jgi:hypothetical protein
VNSREIDVSTSCLPFAAAASHGVDPPREFVGPRRQILGYVEQDLPTIVSRRARPLAGRDVRRLDGITNILPIAFRRLAEQFAGRRMDAARVALIGARLLAGDKEFRRAIDCRKRRVLRLRLLRCALASLRRFAATPAVRR